MPNRPHWSSEMVVGNGRSASHDRRRIGASMIADLATRSLGRSARAADASVWSSASRLIHARWRSATGRSTSVAAGGREDQPVAPDRPHPRPAHAVPPRQLGHAQLVARGDDRARRRLREEEHVRTPRGRRGRGARPSPGSSPAKQHSAAATRQAAVAEVVGGEENAAGRALGQERVQPLLRRQVQAGRSSGHAPVHDLQELAPAEIVAGVAEEVHEVAFGPEGAAQHAGGVLDEADHAQDRRRMDRRGRPSRCRARRCRR